MKSEKLGMVPKWTAISPIFFCSFPNILEFYKNIIPSNFFYVLGHLKIDFFFMQELGVGMLKSKSVEHGKKFKVFFCFRTSREYLERKFFLTTPKIVKTKLECIINNESN